MLAQRMDLCCRCQGGNNAGHTIVADGKKYAFHLLPSGLISPQCTAVIGNGVVVHVPSLFDELDQLEQQGRFLFNHCTIHVSYDQGFEPPTALSFPIGRIWSLTFIKSWMD
jgi:adenylosuccinate synthase